MNIFSILIVFLGFLNAKIEKLDELSAHEANYFVLFLNKKHLL